MTDSEILLVTRGDDAGLASSINAAIHDVVTDGFLQNVSLMAPAPALEDAADRLRSLEHVSTGLHLTLTAELGHPRWGPICPTEEVPSLVNENGDFPRTVERLAAQADIDEMIKEARAQLRTLRTTGFDIRYMDTHMMASRVDGFSDALQEFCDQEGLIFADQAVPAFTIKKGDGSPADRLEEKLQRFGPGTYALVGHPCYDKTDARRINVPDSGQDVVSLSDRLYQTQLFVDPEIADVFDQMNVVLCRYDDI